MGSVYSFLPIKELRPDQEWLLTPELKHRYIRSIHIAAEDEHVFLVDRYNNDSIIELNEGGQMMTEFCFDDLDDEDISSFRPYDICAISPDILAVCGRNMAHDGKIVFLERKKCHPFLELQKTITTEKRFYSLCFKNESLFCLDENCKLHFLSKEGDEMLTIEIDGLTWNLSSLNSRIRVDPVNGEFWGASLEFSEIVSFNSQGNKLYSVAKEEEKFFDFSFDKFGQLYFPTEEGIFSCFPEITLLYKFPEDTHHQNIFSTISVSGNKMIVWMRNGAKDVIKVFKIIYWE